MMALNDWEKAQLTVELAKMKHSEEKILFQFIVGGIISGSVAILIGVIQYHLDINYALMFLAGLK